MSTNTDGSTVGPPDADEPSLRRRRGLLVAVVITVGLMAGAIGVAVLRNRDVTVNQARRASSMSSASPTSSGSPMWTDDNASVAVVGEHAVYAAAGSAVTARDPATGASRWRTDVGKTIGAMTELPGELLEVVRSIGRNGDPPQYDKVLLDEASGRTVATTSTGIFVGRIPNGSLILAQGIEMLDCDRPCERATAVDSLTGQEVWHADLSGATPSIKELTIAPGMLGYADNDGRVTELNLTTGQVLRTFSIPARARPSGYRSWSWVADGPNRSAFVAVDTAGHAVISGIDLTAGGLLWSIAVPVRSRGMGFYDPYVAACGEFLCVTDGTATTAMDPADGHVRFSLPGAVSVTKAGGDWIAHYRIEQARPAYSIESIAFLDPTTMVPGDQTRLISTIAPIGTRPGVTAVEYVVGDTPQTNRTSARDMLLVTVDQRGTVTTVARLPDTNWQCYGGVGIVACVQAKTSTLRVWHL